MNRIARNLTIIYRTERLITRRRLAVVQRQAVLMTLAGLAALAALVMLNVALYFVLFVHVSPAAAAGLLAATNCLLAAFLAMLASRANVETEIAPAIEVRDLAIADIEDEIEGLATEARELANAVRGIGTNPLGSLATALVPIIAAVLKKNET